MPVLSTGRLTKAARSVQGEAVGAGGLHHRQSEQGAATSRDKGTCFNLTWQVPSAVLCGFRCPPPDRLLVGWPSRPLPWSLGFPRVPSNPPPKADRVSPLTGSFSRSLSPVTAQCQQRPSLLTVADTPYPHFFPHPRF